MKLFKMILKGALLGGSTAILLGCGETEEAAAPPSNPEPSPPAETPEPPSPPKPPTPRVVTLEAPSPSDADDTIDLGGEVEELSEEAKEANAAAVRRLENALKAGIGDPE